MNARPRRFRKPDILFILTLIVVLGVVVTTRLQAGELSPAAAPSSPIMGVVPAWMAATTRSAIVDVANLGSRTAAIITDTVSHTGVAAAPDRWSRDTDRSSASPAGLKLALDFGLPAATQRALRDAQGFDDLSTGASPMAPPQGLTLFFSLSRRW
ncbi:MAG: hypothetical protein KGJ12_00165 [Gammaproteobacteria bacterium]|nr:hypothetical protein [Gammaproteobacteria bacterium]